MLQFGRKRVSLYAVSPALQDVRQLLGHLKNNIYERPLLFAHIQTSKGLETVFWTKRTCLWERDREEPKNEIGKQLYDMVG